MQPQAIVIPAPHGARMGQVWPLLSHSGHGLTRHSGSSASSTLHLSNRRWCGGLWGLPPLSPPPKLWQSGSWPRYSELPAAWLLPGPVGTVGLLLSPSVLWDLAGAARGGPGFRGAVTSATTSWPSCPWTPSPPWALCSSWISQPAYL